MIRSPVEIDAAARLVLISVNPRAGARSGLPQIERLASLLKQRDFQVEILDDVRQLAETARRALDGGGLRAVVAAGGDGTAALVANSTSPETPLSILPLGTENLLAKYLGIAPDPEFICNMIDAGLTVQLDAGRAGGRIFLLMVGCGFDAEVVRRVHAARKGHIHHLSYAKPIWDSIRSYQYPELRVCFDDLPGDDSPREVLARWVFVANLPRYARGWNMVPQAVGTDGLLDLCAFRDGSFWRGLWYLGHVIRGSHGLLPSCTMRQVRRIRIESEAEVPFQLDGDPGGTLPVQIEVLPHRLNMIVPKDWFRFQVT